AMIKAEGEVHQVGLELAAEFLDQAAIVAGDAGIGGRDPGAVGQRRFLRRHIALLQLLADAVGDRVADAAAPFLADFLFDFIAGWGEGGAKWENKHKHGPDEDQTRKERTHKPPLLDDHKLNNPLTPTPRNAIRSRHFPETGCPGQFSRPGRRKLPAYLPRS